MDRQTLATPPGSATGADAPVVRRTWLLAPLRHRDGTVEPILTGLLGFPWRSATLDAKCTLQDRDAGSTAHRLVDRHHPAIPAPECTCGIYGVTGFDDDVTVPTARARPIATGFVVLSGRIVRDGPVLRAQRARIVGPLLVAVGRPPFGASLAGAVGMHPRPLRVTVEGGRFIVTWGWGRTRIDDWLEEAAHSLSARYGIETITAPPS